MCGPVLGPNSSMSGSSGVWASSPRIVCTSASNSLHSTSGLESKYRKKVRRLTPAAVAIWSTVVCSKPWSVNRRNAISSRARALVPRGRPRRRGVVARASLVIGLGSGRQVDSVIDGGYSADIRH